MSKLPVTFYQNEDVNYLARNLLGIRLYTCVNGELTAGIIVETEAYKGIEDQASHAYGGRNTSRTQVMYQAGGIAYVYLCYGIHYLFNVVTAPEGIPHAVLIRGIEPIIGIDLMMKRRNMAQLKPNITAGPGALAKALGIDKLLNGKDLLGDEIWLEEGLNPPDDHEVVACPRIGVGYAGDHALLPWRYYYRGNPYVSKPNHL